MKLTGYILPFILIMTSLTAVAGSAVKLPEPKKVTLDNGMTVFLVEDHEIPIVNFNLLIPGAGTAYEDKKSEGIADLTAYLMLKGTKTMTADQIAEELDFMGAFLDGNVAEEYLTLRGYCLSEHLEKLIKIASDSLSNPAFKEDEFKQEIARRIDRIATIKDSPGQAVQFYFRKAYFGEHPMGNLSIGNENSLAAMNLETLKSFYKKYYRPDTSLLAIVGDFDSKILMKILKNTLGKWEKPASPAPNLDLPQLPKIEGKKIIVIDKPDATQTYFVIGAPGFKRGDSTIPAYQVVNTLFGGRFTSWLNTELRIKRGLTYGARSSYTMWKNGGIVNAYSYTQNKNIELMLDITLDLLKKAHSTGFEEKEVESARNYIMGQFPPSLETGSAKARSYVELSFYKLGFDYNNAVLDSIAKATKTQTDATAAQYLPQDNYILVILGKLEQIKPLIAKYGVYTEKKISDSGF